MSEILTLEQVRELTHAFDDFTTVEGSNLPDYYRQFFPTHCKCGGEVIMTADGVGEEGLTQLQCCNPDCWIKMAHRFAYFASSLGYKGFGPAGALTLYANVHEMFKYPTFLSIFLLPTEAIRTFYGDANTENFIQMKEELYNNGFQFKDAISALGIPDLGKGSRLFDIVREPATLINYIAKGKLDELCDGVGIYAPKSQYFLDMYKIDIITLVCDVMPHILSTPKHDVFIAITGSVQVDGKSLTRSEFIWLCESLKDEKGQQAYKIVETKSRDKLEYVIADAPSSSSKYVLGQELNKLVTAQEFIDLLRADLQAKIDARKAEDDTVNGDTTEDSERDAIDEELEETQAEERLAEMEEDASAKEPVGRISLEVRD